jgi:FSR family fosmidomycin resistance protein-like MFS transporter
MLWDKFKKDRYSYLLFLAHTATDINQGALPAMIPFLISEYSLTYAKAAGLILACNLISSIVQPLFGHLGDRYHNPRLIVLSLLLAGGGISLMGFASSYTFLFIFAMLAGIGVALFHPEGAKLANMVASAGKGAGMSIFSTGGNIGFTVGPILVVAAHALFGMHGMLVFFIVTTAVAVLFYIFMHKMEAHAASVQKDMDKQAAAGAAKDRWSGFTIVSLVMSCRSIINTSLNTFIPLVLIVIIGVPNSVGSLGLSLFALCGAIGTFSGGYISDRIGRKKLALICAITSVPLLFLFAFNNNVIAAFILIFFLSIATAGSHSTLIVLGQEFLPNRIGLASGVLLGVTVSVGGILSPAFGHIGDLYGLSATILALGIVSIVSLILTTVIPKS